MTLVHTAEAPHGSDQQIAVAGLMDIEDLVVRQAVFNGVDTKLSPLKSNQAAVVITNPDLAPAILVHYDRFVAGQPFGAAIHAEAVIAEPRQRAVRAHPEIALAILE